MKVGKKDTMFLFLSGIVLIQLIAEFILLSQMGREKSILTIINYFNLLSIGIISWFMVLYVKKNYTSRTSHGTMEKFYNIMKEASNAYYFSQLLYNTIPVMIISLVLILINNINSGIVFFSGYIISSALGFIGIKVANYMNIRMANMAAIHDKREAENVAMYSGLVMGVILLLPLAAIVLCPYIIKNNLFFCFGVALAAILTRLTGGFFTKSADISADMVGKLDYGLPEDDLRNPAVLADNVGDIVGDNIGSCQSFLAIACFIIKNLHSGFTSVSFMLSTFIMIMMISSGFFFATCNKRSINQRILLFLGANVALLTIFIFFYKQIFILNFRSFFLGMMTVLINGFTVYLFTSPIATSWGDWDLPIKDLAKGSQLGAGINVLKGIALGKLCTFVILLEFVIIGLINFWIVDFVWFSMDFAMGVAALSPFIMALDNFGPIADNGGGLVESITDEKISGPARKITDELDKFGNTTKAITKVLNYVLLLALFTPCLFNKTISLNFLNIISGIVGCLLILGFTAFSINIVLSITTSMTHLIKNIFDDNPKILSGEEEPDYKAVINKLTKEVLAKAHWPFYLTLMISLIFVLIIFGIFKQSSTVNIASWTTSHLELFESFSPSAIGLLELLMTLTGVVLGMSMSVSGGAWDNCKKFIESGVYGGKKSLTHNNAVIGDLVGDIYKDTVGPAIAPLILTLYCVVEILCSFTQRFLFF
jgi:K(+)-stimulated pyrophosphate-energized sodium pump